MRTSKNILTEKEMELVSLLNRSSRPMTRYVRLFTYQWKRSGRNGRCRSEIGRWRIVRSWYTLLTVLQH